VNNPLTVRSLKGVRDFLSETEYLRERQRSSFQTGRERLALEQFEHQIIDVVLAPEVAKAADVCVVQRGDGFGLTRESRAELGVSRELARTLTATWRSKRVSRARYTSPMPPVPIRDRTS
jgi:hypothetical protein